MQAEEPMKAKVASRPEFALDRVTREWCVAHRGEPFPPTDKAKRAEFEALLEAAHEADEAEDRKRKAAKRPGK